jgi:hypothetical protein
LPKRGPSGRAAHGEAVSALRPSEELQAARRFALAGTGLLTVGALFGCLFWSHYGRWLWLVAAAIDALSCALVLLRRDRPGQLPFVVGSAVTLAMVWWTNDLLARLGVRCEPFIGYKLYALSVALMAPPSLWLGLGSILACALLPLAEYAGWPAAVRAEIPTPEPATTLLYAIASVGLLFHRRQQMRIHREVVRAQAKTASLELMARKFLAVRDLTNSPLQSVELTVALLKTRHPESQAQLERLERQLARLRQLSVVLSQYEPQRWAPEDGSFDPLEVLQSPEK